MKRHNDSNLYEFISSASNEGFRYVNYDTGYVIVSEKWRTMFGVPKENENDEKKFEELIHPDYRKKFYDKMERILAKQETSYEIEYVLKDGRWISHAGTNKFDSEGVLVEKFSFFRDITEDKEKQKELEYMAYFDADTGVYNKNYFLKRLDKAIYKSQHGGYNRIQVMYMDIDNFSVINDTIGLSMGDELLILFAKRIIKYASHTTKIGRFSNDEFAIALYDAESDSEIFDIYKNLVEELSKPFVLSDGKQINVTLSVGISIYPTGGVNAIDLIKCADIAMYNVKRNGKNSMCVFEESMLSKLMKNAKMEQKLKNAVDNLDFVLHYQPQFDSEKKIIRGVEALIRWKISENELISPGEFIPMAEKNGCIVNIGEWVVNQALEDFCNWKDNYGYKGIISINFSAVQLMDSMFYEMITGKVDEKKINPADVEIEITESVLIEEPDKVIKQLSDLREKGFKISLDDFGTGYSSLSYLKNIPIDTLKIDKSFIDSMLNDDSTGIITDAVIKMVKKLGFETIAEGVETEDQYEYLKKMDCDNIQGFLLGKPMSSEDFIELIKRRNIR